MSRWHEIRSKAISNGVIEIEFFDGNDYNCTVIIFKSLAFTRSITTKKFGNLAVLITTSAFESISLLFCRNKSRNVV